MSTKNFLFTTGALVAGLVASTVGANAQGPLYDKVIVDLPYAVTINNTVLQPGHYVIRQMDDAGTNSRVLMIFANNGMKLKATALTIAALDNNTPDKTSVVLHHYGSDYYFDKVWVQGKNYGYEFPLPPAVKARQREAMQPYTVAATYEQTDKKRRKHAGRSEQQQFKQQQAAVQQQDNSVNTTPAPAPDGSAEHRASGSVHDSCARHAPYRW